MTSGHYQLYWKKLKTHVVFIHSDKDTWVPIENIAFGKKIMTNAKSIYSDTLYGAGHQIPWERFDEVKKALLNLPY
jgi:predicted esterase